MSEPTLKPSNFRRFFFRGLGILLPSLLTIWILVAAYNFLQYRIAGPINAGVREVILYATPWPVATEEQMLAFEIKPDNLTRVAAWRASGRLPELRRFETRRELLNIWWTKYAFPLDLIGLFIAIVLIYILGALLGSYIGARLYARGENLLRRLPLIRQVYPSVKQVTDFLVGGDDNKKIKFSKVVAVEYPRKGLWSIGLLTGDTMRIIEDSAGVPCVTVFVPSSPTPFTGYVVTVPKADTIDLPITVEEAIRFTVSGGVIVPPHQQTLAAQAIERERIDAIKNMS